METSIKLFQKELCNKKYNPLPKEEQYQMGLDYLRTKNPILKDKLIHHNLRYAVKLAYGWSMQYPIEDCISICMESLTQIPDVWNPNKGTFLTLLKKNTQFCFQKFETQEAHTIKISTLRDRKPATMVSTASTASHSNDGKEYTIIDNLVSDYIDVDSVLERSNELKEVIWNEVHNDCYRFKAHGINNHNSFDILRGKFAEKELKVYIGEMGQMYGGVTRQAINQASKSATRRLAKNSKLKNIFQNELNNLK